MMASGWLILNEKLTPAEQRGRPAQKHLFIPFDRLSSAGSKHSHRRAHLPRVDGSDGCSAGACARRQRLADATFVETHLNLLLARDHHEFHVHAVLEIAVG